jgi:hypothetical protein
MGPDPQEALPNDEAVVRRRPLLALLAVLVAVAIVVAAIGGNSFVGPTAPTPEPTPIDAQTA